MTKKEYILAVIDALPEWEMWRWIKAMVQNDQLDEHSIDMLVVILKKAMDKIAKVIKEKKVILIIIQKVKISKMNFVMIMMKIYLLQIKVVK